MDRGAPEKANELMPASSPNGNAYVPETLNWWVSVEGEAAEVVRHGIYEVEVVGLKGDKIRLALIHETIVVSLQLRIEIASPDVIAVGEAVVQVQLKTPEVAARFHRFARLRLRVLRVVREAVGVRRVGNLPEGSFAYVDQSAGRGGSGRDEFLDLHARVEDGTPILEDTAEGAIDPLDPDRPVSRELEYSAPAMTSS